MSDPPEEYVYFILGEKFGWTPLEIDEQDANVIDILLETISMDNKVKNKK